MGAGGPEAFAAGCAEAFAARADAAAGARVGLDGLLDG